MTADPSQTALRADLESAQFEDGAERGRWRFVSLDWPYLTLAISAGDGNELGMRIQVNGYPTAPPAGIPWDLDVGCALPLARLPMGGGAQQVFRSQWSISNSNTPYMATERRIIVPGGHEAWAQQHAEPGWNPNRTIAFYAQQLHAELRGCTIPGEPDAA